MREVSRRCPICAQAYAEEEERLCPVHGLPLVEPRLPAPDAIGELTGRVLDSRYLIGGLIGRGGMGVVYLAENLRLGRRVAIKVLHRDLSSDGKMRQRLFREVQATCRIDHPAVITIFDYGEDPTAGCYLVLEYLEGTSLEGYLRQHRRLAVATALKLTAQIAGALAATHGAGLIHRDLKPSNVWLLPDGRVKVLDFGLVKPTAGNEDTSFVTITTAGMALGTPWYMAPEQASFRPLDPRSDIYSLGVVLYELLTGRTPFISSNPLEVVLAQRNDPAPLPRELSPPVELPQAVELLLLRLLAKDPERRPQSCAELIDELYGIALENDIELGEVHVVPNAEASPPRELREDPHATLIDEALPAPPEPLEHTLAAALEQRRGELTERVLVELRQAFPHYRALELLPLRASIDRVLRVVASALLSEGEPLLPDALKQLADERTEQQFTIVEVLGSFLLGWNVCRPLFAEVVQHDPLQLVALQERADRRILALYLRLVEHYFARFNGRLIRLNDLLTRRNSQLQAIRQEMTEQVRATSGQLAEVERLKARVVDGISSGLLLVDDESRRIILCNRAFERIFGIPAADLIGRTLDHALGFVEGIPQDELGELLRLHGEIGLRKLRVALNGGAHRTVYLRGERFEAPRGGTPQLLFVVDDVTEREQIINSFSRYVSRDVVRRVLKLQGSVQPSGERVQAALLACGLEGFGGLLAGLDAEAATLLLSEYLRLIGDAVFRHGGIVEAVVGDAVLVYFAQPRGSCAGALSAAQALCQDADIFNAQRRARGEPVLPIGLGVHVGEILLLNVGSDDWMAQTIVGDAAALTRALQRAAAAGEVLLSAAAAAAAGPTAVLAPGPTIDTGKGRQPTFRMASSRMVDARTVDAGMLEVRTVETTSSPPDPGAPSKAEAAS
ncbi:MAG: protein kinase [Proteobacteria bacterium]|nr:protein kinase [Pseudomonadota bacterium]